MSGPKKPRTQRAIARGHVAELRAKGVTLGRDGRARLHGRLLSTESLQRRVAGLAGAKAARRLDARLRKQGLTPAQVEKATPANVARWVDVSEDTARRWLRDGGGLSDYQLDRVARSIENAYGAGGGSRKKPGGRTIYDATWEHGRAKTVPRAWKKELRRLFHRFLTAKKKRSPDVSKRHVEFYRYKVFIRERLTMSAFDRLMHDLSKGEKLDQLGFSVVAFVTS